MRSNISVRAGSSRVPNACPASASADTGEHYAATRVAQASRAGRLLDHISRDEWFNCWGFIAAFASQQGQHSHMAHLPALLPACPPGVRRQQTGGLTETVEPCPAARRSCQQAASVCSVCGMPAVAPQRQLPLAESVPSIAHPPGHDRTSLPAVGK